MRKESFQTSERKSEIILSVQIYLWRRPRGVGSVENDGPIDLPTLNLSAWKDLLNKISTINKKAEKASCKIN